MESETGDALEELEQQRERLNGELTTLGDMRQGSLLERYRKCGKGGCRCAADDAFAHGPSWSLTRALKGKTITRVIPRGALEQTREQLGKFKEFQGLSRALLEVNEKICEAKLARPEIVAQGTVKKRASRPSSKRRSLPKSKR